MASPQFRYFDFNNNYYTVEKLKVVYTPITKETSFSGKYDGGKAVNGKVTQKALDKINAKLETISDSKSLRTKHRSGICAMLIIYGEEKNKRFILPESAEQKKLEDMLKSAVGID